MMRKKSRAIFMVLLFVVMLSPVRISATEPSFLYPTGIVIEISECDESINDYDDFIIDVIVKRDDYLGNILAVPNNWPVLPDDLLTSEYASSTSEWMSMILYDSDAYWNNETCRTLFYEYAYDEEDFPFSEYRIVVYEKGQDPVVSKTYFTSNSATWENPNGFKIIYHRDDQTFSLQGYEAEMIGGYNPGFFNSYMFLIVMFMGVVLFIFGFMESVIYLIAKQGKNAILISLGCNILAIAYVLSQFIDFFRIGEQLYGILGLFLIANLYVGKVFLLHRYSPLVYRISILFSVLFYCIFTFFLLGAIR